jgi:hypothetical protein
VTPGAIRPSDWEFPVFLHVLGATLLVGTLSVAVVALIAAWRRDRPAQVGFLSRLGFWTLLLGVFPSFWLMRLAGEWAASKEFDDSDDDPAWLEIGYLVGDIGLLLLIVTIVLAGVGVYMLRRGERARSGLARVGAVLATILLAAYVVAVWAMTAKPG